MENDQQHLFDKHFIECIRTMAYASHELAKEKGWWKKPYNASEAAAHFHSEISEFHEGMRTGNPESKKIPGFSSEEEELADAILWILDWAGHRNLRLGAAILAKHRHNMTRPQQHGKEF